MGVWLKMETQGWGNWHLKTWKCHISRLSSLLPQTKSWQQRLSMLRLSRLDQFALRVKSLTRFSQPLYNEFLGLTNDFHQRGQNYSKMYGTEPLCNEPRFNDILVIRNTIQRPTRKIYLDITKTSTMWRKMNAKQTKKGEISLILIIDQKSNMKATRQRLITAYINNNKNSYSTTDRLCPLCLL